MINQFIPGDSFFIILVFNGVFMPLSHFSILWHLSYCKKNQVLDCTGRNVKKQWLAVTLVNSHQWRSFMGVPIKPDDLELYTEVNSKHMDYIYDPPWTDTIVSVNVNFATTWSLISVLIIHGI